MYIAVVYDISDNKKRNKAANILLNFGGIRVQKSVFEIEVSKNDYYKLRSQLDKLTISNKDSLRFYILCKDCVANIDFTGRYIEIKKENIFII